MKIIGDKIYHVNRNENISVKKASEGLSKFFKESIQITKENLDYFAGDIQAFCFGFKNVPKFKAIFENGKIEIDTFNNMQEAYFIFSQNSQNGKIIKIKQI